MKPLEEDRCFGDLGETGRMTFILKGFTWSGHCLISLLTFLNIVG